MMELLLLRRLHFLRRRWELLLLLSTELTVSYISALYVYDYNVVCIKTTICV